MPGRTSVAEFGTQYRVQAEVVGSAAPFRTTFILDSILALGEGSDAEDAPAGSYTFVGSLASTGRVSGFSPAEQPEQPPPTVAEIAGRLVQNLFPVVPHGGAQVGMTWSDTVETSYPSGRVDNVVHTIVTYRALEWTDRHGERALHITAVSEFTFSGSGVQLGQAFTIRGQGRRHADYHVSATGRLLGFTSADTSDAEAALQGAGIVIPVRQTRADTLFIRQ
jgi:hypothetical protein